MSCRSHSSLDRSARTRLVAVLQRRHPVQSACMSLLTAGLVLANLGVAAKGVLVSHAMLVDRGMNPSSTINLMLVMCAFLIASLPGPVLALVIRDVWRGWLVRRFQRGCSCVWCGYSLADLEEDRGVLGCPECGAGFKSVNTGWVPVCVLKASGSLTPDLATACRV